ncbi:hypothetical protein HKW97_23965 (plasmid) [Pseudomonas luteola]|uniref:hypothetical protein n=1 Tax=Pseudomonas luteola TaxID=47886 RepID=UPI00388D4B08
MSIRKLLSTFKRGHNQRLAELVSRMVNRIDQAHSTSDFVAVIREVGAFDESLRYNLIVPGLILIPLWVVFLFGFSLLVNGPPDWGWIAWLFDYLNAKFVGLCILFPMSFVNVLYTSSVVRLAGEISTLSRYVAERYLHLTYQISEVQPDAGMQLSWLAATFKDFSRGTKDFFDGYKQYLAVALSGIYRGQFETFTYSYHHLRYTIKRSSASEDELDRYSLTVEFPWVREVTVRGEFWGSVDREVRWKTSNTRFNRCFTLTGSREDVCEGFARAEMLECCLKLAACLKDMNMEFSDTGYLCLSFDNDLMEIRTWHTLHNAKAFEAEMQEGFRLPHLDFTLAQLERMRALYT